MERPEPDQLVILEDFIRESHENAIEHGFHERIPSFGVKGADTRHILSWLMLINTELAEAAEAARKNDRENFAEEMADTCIRIFDTCGALNVDLKTAIITKMKINRARPIMHGGKLA